MKTNFLTLIVALLPLLSAANNWKEYGPYSALEFQQTTDSRIMIEGNFLRFYTTNTERITVDENGNVGIGINSPTSLMHISEGNILVEKTTGVSPIDPASIALKSSSISSNWSITETWGNLDFESVDGSGAGSGVRARIGAYMTNAIGGNTGLKFFTSNGNGSGLLEKMVIDQSGKVGIGTSSPANAILHLYKDDTNGSITSTNISGSALRIQDESTNMYLDGNSIYSTGNMNIAAINASRLSLGTNGEERVQITSDGKVGIGTENPAQKLSVIEGDLYIGRNTTNQVESGRIRLTERTGAYQGGYIHYDGDLNRIKIGVHDNNNSTISDDFDAIVINRSNGKIGIGTDPSSYRLEVSGTINATTYRASGTQVWPDYVFEDTYELNELQEVEKYIEKNHHLPEIPSAAEVEKNGVDLVSMQAKLLQKIEELTLHMIELKKENEDQQQRIKKLESIQPMAKSK